MNYYAVVVVVVTFVIRSGFEKHDNNMQLFIHRNMAFFQGGKGQQKMGIPPNYLQER